MRRGLLEGPKGFDPGVTLAFLLMKLTLGTHYKSCASMQLPYSFSFLAIGFSACTEKAEKQVQAY